ncbi:hypothetical protein HJC99_06480 [Candidatus Saccharibacteria bacterium]|nr:hypothetical protein [Candidatus Saccharibacteria bacterium]
MKRFASLVFATATMIASLVIPLTVSAAAAVKAPSATTNNQSFQISPPTSTYAADPGTTVKGVIKVNNLTNAALSLTVGKENFVAKGEEGEIELTDNADPLYSLAPWFNAAVTQITVPPLGTTSFNYTIAVPANAEPGGRYGSITFNTIAPKLAGGESGAAVQQQLAAIIFLRINGPANESLKIDSFATGTRASNGNFTAKSFFEYAPVDFLTRVQNTGTVHEKPTGTITIKNMFGFTTATIPLDEHYVIPGAIRALHNVYPTSNQKKLMFGRYTAHINATYANGKTLSADVSFTVIPYKLLVIIFVVLLIVFIVFWRGRKRLARAGRILAGKE